MTAGYISLGHGSKKRNSFDIPTIVLSNLLVPSSGSTWRNYIVKFKILVVIIYKPLETRTSNLLFFLFNCLHCWLRTIETWQYPGEPQVRACNILGSLAQFPRPLTVLFHHRSQTLYIIVRRPGSVPFMEHTYGLSFLCFLFINSHSLSTFTGSHFILASSTIWFGGLEYSILQIIYNFGDLVTAYIDKFEQPTKLSVLTYSRCCCSILAKGAFSLTGI